MRRIDLVVCAIMAHAAIAMETGPHVFVFDEPAA
jgi:hypothetical protein